jgi:scyllo-inositol 2-dehydrogenase (NAD+)
MEQLEAAVIGCGRMGAFTSESVLRYAPSCWFPLSHAEAINQHHRLRLVALCDLDSTNLRRAADHYKIHRCYTNGVELLETEKPALLGLATRTPGRSEIIQAAVEVGTHAIHTEKPLCNSFAELNKLRDIFQKDYIFVTWGAIRRFLGVYRQAVSLAESGLYGNLVEIRVNFGSGSLYWCHPHSIDLLLFAASDRVIESVQARLGVLENKNKRTLVENDPRIITATIYFDDGVIGHITQAQGADFVLCCEKAEIIVRSDGGIFELYSSKDGPYPTTSTLVIHDDERPGGSLGPISQLVRCLEGDEESIQANAILKRSILDAQLIAFAMLQSHLEGSKPIGLQSVDPDIVIMGCTDGRYA